MIQAPIGIFDSGIGGLSILKEIVKTLPDTSVYYAADTVHCPYGNKSPEYIIERARKLTAHLIQKGVKLIVVACNTATAFAIKDLRNTYNIPFVGIEPAIKPAVKQSLSARIGVLATARTLQSDFFEYAIQQYAQETEVLTVAGEGLVEYVEKNALTDPALTRLLADYLQPLIEANIDQLVLGCTHYPFLLSLIQDIIPPKITVINPAGAVAAQTKRILESLSIKKDAEGFPTYVFCSNQYKDQQFELFSKIIGVTENVYCLSEEY